MGNLGEEYEILEEIGRGNYSICKRCIHRASKVNMCYAKTTLNGLGHEMEFKYLDKNVNEYLPLLGFEFSIVISHAVR